MALRRLEAAAEPAEELLSGREEHRGRVAVHLVAIFLPTAVARRGPGERLFPGQPQQRELAPYLHRFSGRGQALVEEEGSGAVDQLAQEPARVGSDVEELELEATAAIQPVSVDPPGLAVVAHEVHHEE